MKKKECKDNFKSFHSAIKVNEEEKEKTNISNILTQSAQQLWSKHTDLPLKLLYSSEIFHL